MNGNQTNKRNFTVGSIRREQEGAERQAVVFIHGFSGSASETWRQFARFVSHHLAQWDIFTLGYPTSNLPDFLGIWTADPDIETLAKLTATRFRITRLRFYPKWAIVAHSMGGLVIERMMLDNPDLAKRVSHLVMFGTPNNGLHCARALARFKRPLKNLACDSEFIRDLRERWNQVFASPHFRVAVVAGARDSFVPPWTNFTGFAPEHQFVVDGDHLSMIKPVSPDEMSVQLVLNELISPPPGQGQAPATAVDIDLQPVPSRAKYESDTFPNIGSISGSDLVAKALELERKGYPGEAASLLKTYLDQHQASGAAWGSQTADIMGSLAGQLKRLWLRQQEASTAGRPAPAAAAQEYTHALPDEFPQIAMALYTDALYQSFLDDNSEQIYYQAINVAFGALVWYHDLHTMKRAAAVALKHASAGPPTCWSVATMAEACLYLNETKRAVELYRQAAQWNPRPKNFDSTVIQANAALDALTSHGIVDPVQLGLLDEFERIFSPHAEEVDRAGRLSPDDSDYEDLEVPESEIP